MRNLLTTIIVVPDMKLSPNVGSDRSWVWNAAADVSEGEPEPQTLAIRFANSESELYAPELLECRSLMHGQMPICSKKLLSRLNRRMRNCSAKEKTRRSKLRPGHREHTC